MRSSFSSQKCIITNRTKRQTAGEAIGKWQMLQPKQNGTVLDDGRIELPNILELPFRCQAAPGEWKNNHKLDLSSCSILSSHYEICCTSLTLVIHTEYKSRESEARQMDFLLQMNKRYPHAWYARRFFNKVSVSTTPGPHFGMGLDCYVQWTR
jgi:hypothetical protein